MTPDPLDRLRAANPVPTGSAPGVERVLARIDGASDRPQAWAGLRPGLAVAFSLAVVAAVVAVVLPGRHAATSGYRTATGTPSVPAMTPALRPGMGMRGPVLLDGDVSATARTQSIGLIQELGHVHGVQTMPLRGVRARLWVLHSTDGGALWRVQQSPGIPVETASDGDDVWMRALTIGHGGQFYVSHDGGLTWQLAHSSVPASSFGGMSIAGGEVWSLAGTGSHSVVVHGSAGGHSLSATAARPPLGASTNIDVVGVSAQSAFVFSGLQGRRAWRTDNGGHSWKHVSLPCVAIPQLLSIGAAQGYWAACLQPAHGGASTRIERSTDGGRSWHTVSTRPGVLNELTATSPSSAWAVTAHGALLHLTDGGRARATIAAVQRGLPSNTTADGAPVIGTGADGSVILAQAIVDGHGRERRSNVIYTRVGADGHVKLQTVVTLPTG